MLERAAELQARALRNYDDDGGLTLEELEDVAAEVGLDPSFLRQAADELDAGVVRDLMNGVTPGTDAKRVDSPQSVQVHAHATVDLAQERKICVFIDRADQRDERTITLPRTLDCQSPRVRRHVPTS